MKTVSHESVEVVRRYLDARNRGNVGSALRLMSRSISYRLVGGWHKKGRRQVRRLEEWGKAMGCRLEAEDITDHGEWISCSLKETNDWLPLLGSDPIVYDECEFWAAGGRISSVRIRISRESGQELGEAVLRVLEWAVSHRPGVASRIISDGQFVHSRRNALRWMRLVEGVSNDLGRV